MWLGNLNVTTYSSQWKKNSGERGILKLEMILRAQENRNFYAVENLENYFSSACNI